MKLPIHINVFGNCPEDQLTLAYSLTGLLRFHGFDAIYKCPNACDPLYHTNPGHSFVISIDTNFMIDSVFHEQNNFNIWVEFNLGRRTAHDIPFEYTGVQKNDIEQKYGVKFNVLLDRFDAQTCQYLEEIILTPQQYS